ncbi:uncharacterized protein TNCV_3059211 [Trichonephila clavipes]|nr:uncharacterized protein TNCV_3059211 [Trichonephila clavipes]
MQIVQGIANVSVRIAYPRFPEFQSDATRGILATDLKITWSVAKSPRVAEQCDVNVQSILATDHVILNHGQVTWTTPELAPPLLTTTPHQREDVSAFDRFNVHRCPTRRVFNGTGLELVTRQATVRYLYHSATAATGNKADTVTSYSLDDRHRRCQERERDYPIIRKHI